MSKKLRLFIVLVLMSTLSISLLASEAFAAGVQIVVYPANVIQQVPANDTGADGGPVYRANNTNAMNAPFVVGVRVVGYYNGSDADTESIRLWLTDNQAGATVDTYDRFDGGTIDKDLGDPWLAESATAPAGLDGTEVTASVFYVMVIGRVAGSPGASPTYTINYELDLDGDGYDDGSGSVAAGGASTLLTANQQDWYLNWNDTDPESGDPVTAADYIELFDDSFNSVTTAPVDASGYFQAVLPGDPNGVDYLAEARSESGSIARTWVTNITTTGAGTDDELINAGTGAPTAVTLSDVTAESPGLWVALASVAVVVIVGGAVLLLRRRRVA